MNNFSMGPSFFENAKWLHWVNSTFSPCRGPSPCFYLLVVLVWEKQILRLRSRYHHQQVSKITFCHLKHEKRRGFNIQIETLQRILGQSSFDRSLREVSKTLWSSLVSHNSQLVPLCRFSQVPRGITLGTFNRILQTRGNQLSSSIICQNTGEHRWHLCSHVMPCQPRRSAGGFCSDIDSSIEVSTCTITFSTIVTC